MKLSDQSDGKLHTVKIEVKQLVEIVGEKFTGDLEVDSDKRSFEKWVKDRTIGKSFDFITQVKAVSFL